ncbi:hypothetical protein [Intestinibaculum porci]|uniref:hypothetical protein n=1 Tax=Intestinibaculum porci TaxID=2487118 RepID=UPI00240A5D30|nr:hypothetical protein [Intestinibaculum porci]MDD6349003.1 hypothetical protein [Intestinibaculum porci]
MYTQKLLIYCHESCRLPADLEQLRLECDGHVLTNYLDYLLELSNPLYTKRIFIDDGYHKLDEFALFLVSNHLKVQLIGLTRKREIAFEEAYVHYLKGVKGSNEAADTFFVFYDENHRLKKLYSRDIYYVYHLADLYYIYSRRGLLKTNDEHFVKHMSTLKKAGFLSFSKDAYLNTQVPKKG